MEASVSKGFSLLEVVVAFAIMSMLASVLLPFASQSIRQTQTAFQKARAASLRAINLRPPWLCPASHRQKVAVSIKALPIVSTCGQKRQMALWVLVYMSSIFKYSGQEKV